VPYDGISQLFYTFWNYAVREKVPKIGGASVARAPYFRAFPIQLRNSRPFSNFSSHRRNLTHLLFVILPSVLMNSSLCSNSSWVKLSFN